MNARRTEDQHHSAEQVSEYLAGACSIADAHELTPNERAALLPVLVQLLSAKQIFYDPVAPVGAILPPIGAR